MKKAKEANAMIDLKKAQQQILAATPILGRESVPILEALHRVVAEDVVATEDLPVADISALDGYAIAYASLADASGQRDAQMTIVGESPAGTPCQRNVGNGEAVRIMTGGLLPFGADTVVKIENTVETNGRVVCTRDPGCGAGIRWRGESLRRGEVVVSAGDVVGPLEVGALASLRRAYVHVHRKPVVAIFSTGDELADFHEPPTREKAMCSNLYALAAQVMESNATPLCLGIVGDDLAAQRDLLAEALRADVIVTSGGTSRGKYDLVHKAFAAMGIRLRFSNMFAKPGKPTIFGTVENHLLFGLPGNPTAAMLSFEQFVRPALLKLMGRTDALDAFCDRSGEQRVRQAFAQIDAFNVQQKEHRANHRASQLPLKSLLTPVEGPAGRHPERKEVRHAVR